MLADILDAAGRHSGRPAINIGGCSYSYGQLMMHVRHICSLLGRTEETTIGIAAEDTLETYASILAALFSGVTYVILHPEYPAERNSKIAELAGVGTLLYCARCGGADGIPGINYIRTSAQDIPEDLPECNITFTDSPAYIIFTSGSTGEPKGVPISRENLNAFYEAYGKLGWELDENDRMLQMFQLTFDVSVVSFLYPLTIGACVYTVPPGGLKYLNVIDTVERGKVTFAAVAPSVLRLLRRYFDEISLPHLRYLALTAEAADAGLIDDFRKCIPNARIVNLYGPTEATIYCTSYTVPETGCKHHNGMISIGRPLSGITAATADGDGVILPEGETGELWISGPQVMQGYWNDAAKTEKCFAHTPDGRLFYRTGDLCFIDSDGDIIYCGRMDNQVKIQGFRIELSEIEYRARLFSGNKCDTAAVVIDGAEGESELHLAVTGVTGNIYGLDNYLRRHLPYYMIPKQIHVLTEFPQNTNNKTDRKEICQIIKNKMGNGKR